MRTRGALALLRFPSFRILARDGRRCPLSHLPGATAQACLSPRACASSQSPTLRILYQFVGSCRPGWYLW
eukprot:4048089-Pleurochrysis_carterae.AAC.7